MRSAHFASVFLITLQSVRRLQGTRSEWLAYQQVAAVKAAPTEDRGIGGSSVEVEFLLYYWTFRVESVLECLLLDEQRNCFGSHLAFCGGAAEEELLSSHRTSI